MRETFESELYAVCTCPRKDEQAEAKLCQFRGPEGKVRAPAAPPTAALRRSQLRAPLFPSAGASLSLSPPPAASLLPGYLLARSVQHLSCIVAKYHSSNDCIFVFFFFPARQSLNFAISKEGSEGSPGRAEQSRCTARYEGSWRHLVAAVQTAAAPRSGAALQSRAGQGYRSRRQLPKGTCPRTESEFSKSFSTR